LSIHLETLDLSENLLHDGGGRLVAEGLQKNESVKRIYMQSNSLEMAAGRAFQKAAEKNNYLLVLNLADNHIDLSVLAKIKLRLERNKEAAGTKELQDLRKEERDIERDKNAYRNEKKLQLIRDGRGLNKKKRLTRLEECGLREELAEMVAANDKLQAGLDKLRAAAKAKDDENELKKLSGHLSQLQKTRRQAQYKK